MKPSDGVILMLMIILVISAISKIIGTIRETAVAEKTTVYYEDMQCSKEGIVEVELKNANNLNRQWYTTNPPIKCNMEK